MGYADDARHFNGRVFLQRRFDLGGGDVHAGRFDDVLDAPEEVQMAGGVEPRQITGVEVAARVKAVVRCHLVVMQHHARAAHQQLTFGINRQRLAGLRVRDAELQARHRPAV